MIHQICQLQQSPWELQNSSSLQGIRMTSCTSLDWPTILNRVSSILGTSCSTIPTLPGKKLSKWVSVKAAKADAACSLRPIGYASAPLPRARLSSSQKLPVGPSGRRVPQALPCGLWLNSPRLGCFQVGTARPRSLCASMNPSRRAAVLWSVRRPPTNRSGPDQPRSASHLRKYEVR